MLEISDLELELKLEELLDSLPTKEEQQQTLDLIDTMIEHGVPDDVAVDFLLNKQTIQ